MEIRTAFFFICLFFALAQAAQAESSQEREPSSVPTSESINPMAAAKGKAEQTKDSGSPLGLADLKVNVGGFVWIEFEDSRNFGYNAGSQVPDFDGSASNSHQAFSTLLSNLQVDLSKGPTTFTSIFEVGEMIDGEQTTGGSVGGRQKVLEVRDIYLNHDLNADVSLKAGLQPFLTDPNGFILSDHLAAATLIYRRDNLIASVWTAKATDNKPGVSSTASNYVRPDSYWGGSIEFAATETLKGTTFGVSRRTSESLFDEDSNAVVTGASNSQWLGTTMDWTPSTSFSWQGTYIYNQGQFQADTGGASDSMRAALADMKFKAALPSQRMEFLLEGLATTGASDQVATGQTVATLKRRSSFSAPDPGAVYLLTIATSDGADDAPGTAKESMIGNLNQAEGLQVAVLKVSKSFSDNFATFLRYGQLQSTVARSTTQSRDLGNEWDLEGTYEMSPGTTLQLDAAIFTPGAFFVKQDAATFFSTRLKFNF